MAKGLTRSLRRAAPQLQRITKQVIPVRNFLLTVNGASGVGFGTGVVGELPEGNILFLGAVGYFVTTATNAGIVATYNATVSLGTAPTADSTLSGAEVDLLAATALGAATANVSPRVRITNATQSMLDNTDNSLEINLNVTVPDLDISANGVILSVTADIVLSYVVMADN
jgi:hypothetical protein